MSEIAFEELAVKTIQEARKYSRRELARASDFSPSKISGLLNGQLTPTSEALLKIQGAINVLDKEAEESEWIISRAREMSLKMGLRKFGKLVGVDAANLSHALSGKRSLSRADFVKLEAEIIKSIRGGIHINCSQ